LLFWFCWCCSLINYTSWMFSRAEKLLWYDYIITLFFCTYKMIIFVPFLCWQKSHFGDLNFILFSFSSSRLKITLPWLIRCLRPWFTVQKSKHGIIFDCQSARIRIKCNSRIHFHSCFLGDMLWNRCGMIKDGKFVYIFLTNQILFR